MNASGAGTGLWAGAGGENSTGDDWEPTVTKEAFYTSGQNAQFTVINGVFSPIINMKVSRLCWLNNNAWCLLVTDVR